MIGQKTRVLGGWWEGLPMGRALFYATMCSVAIASVVVSTVACLVIDYVPAVALKWPCSFIVSLRGVCQ